MPFGDGGKLIELVEARDAEEVTLAKSKARLADLNEQIKIVTAPLVATAYDHADKPDGTVRFACDNHIFKCEVAKRVTWDSDRLAMLAADMEPGAARGLFKIEYSVPETKFKAVTDTILRHNLTAARTVKYGEPKITLADWK